MVSWVRPCPHCAAMMEEPDLVDVGIGMVQCGPYVCDSCGASEIGPEYRAAKAAGELNPDEIRTHFYQNGRISPHANQHNGKVISHKLADALYRADHFTTHGNPYNAPIARL